MDYRGLASCLSCCECGTPISYNAVNMCEACMVNLVDITKSINKQIAIGFCFTCSRFLSPPSMWIPENNTEQLLKACLKLIKGLHKYKVQDAKFLWTEPHSKRKKVELVIRQDVSETASAGGLLRGGAAIEQTVVVEFTMQSNICSECQREAAKDYWNASVQVRQKTSHKKTMYYMEQIILKGNAHKDCLNIKKVAGGVDFFFSSKNNALTFIQYLQRRLPIRYQESKKLIGHDIGNSTYNYKYTYCVEIPPVCKDDLVCLSRDFAQKLGNLNQLCIISKITENIHLIDPVTCKTRHIDANLYYQHEFLPVGSSRNLTQYLVVESEIVPPTKSKPGDCALSSKHTIADAYVYRANEMSEQIHTRTHLGGIIQAGDIVLGIDMRTLNHNNDELGKINSNKIPDVILIKKYYDRSLRIRARPWRTKRLALEGSVTNTEGDDQQEFLEDLEEDPEIRANVDIYQCKYDIDPNNEEFAGLPTIPLEEMIRNLDLSSAPVVDEIPQKSNEGDVEMMDM